MMMHRLRVDTPSPCPSKALFDLVKPLPTFDRVSVGFPSYVHTA
jgi:hypothetical protein